jgi:nucleotide-binding universal stress UspA family protein
LLKKGDTVKCIHVCNPHTAESLPHEARPASVKDYYENKLTSRLPKASWSFQLVNKDEGSTTSKTLLRLLQKMKDIDWLVVGYSAPDPKDPSKLGSVTSMSLREAHMPVIINKNTSVPEQPVFVAGTDGSEWGHSSVLVSMRLSKSAEKVHAVHVEDASAQVGAKKQDSDEVEARYKVFCAANPSVTFHRVLKTAGQGIAETLLSQASDFGANFVVVGVDQMAKYAAGKPDHYVGSFTDRVVHKSHCSIILYQDRHSTFETSSDGKMRRSSNAAAAAAGSAAAGSGTASAGGGK